MLQRYQVGLKTGKRPRHVNSELLVLVQSLQCCLTRLVKYKKN